MLQYTHPLSPPVWCSRTVLLTPACVVRYALPLIHKHQFEALFGTPSYFTFVISNSRTFSYAAALYYPNVSSTATCYEKYYTTSDLLWRHGAWAEYILLRNIIQHLVDWFGMQFFSTPQVLAFYL